MQQLQRRGTSAPPPVESATPGSVAGAARAQALFDQFLDMLGGCGLQWRARRVRPLLRDAGVSEQVGPATDTASWPLCTTRRQGNSRDASRRLPRQQSGLNKCPAFNNGPQGLALHLVCLPAATHMRVQENMEVGGGGTWKTRIASRRRKHVAR